MTEFTENDFNEMIVDLNPDDSLDINETIDSVLKLIRENKCYAGDNLFTCTANILVCALARLILKEKGGQELDEYFCQVAVSLLRTNLHQNRVLNSGDK